jgi:hypothetical protein
MLFQLIANNEDMNPIYKRVRVTPAESLLVHLMMRLAGCLLVLWLPTALASTEDGWLPAQARGITITFDIKFFSAGLGDPFASLGLGQLSPNILGLNKGSKNVTLQDTDLAYLISLFFGYITPLGDGISQTCLEASSHFITEIAQVSHSQMFV